MSQELFELYCSRLDALKRPVESPEAIFRRTAKAIAQVELAWSARDAADYYQGEYFKRLRALDFIPSPSILKEAGKDKPYLMTDYAWPLEDSLESIVQALKQIIELSPLGGSLGLDFSCLRPAKDMVTSVHGEASGPVEFLKILDQSAAQQKPFYPKKHFALLNFNHPDILDYLENASSFKAFEVAVGLSSHFMRCLKKHTTYPLLHPKSGKVTASMAATELFERLCAKLKQGEGPSLVFLDSLRREHVGKDKQEGLALCAEGTLALAPGEVAAYGMINLGNMVSAEGIFDEERLEINVDLAVRFLDNVLKQSESLLPGAKAGRKIGLGLMGLAPLLFQLKKPFSSPKTKSFVISLLKFFYKRAKQASLSLAKQRGALTFLNERNLSLSALGASSRMARLSDTTPGLGLWESWQTLRTNSSGKLSPHLVREIQNSFQDKHAFETLERSLMAKAWESPPVLISKTQGLLTLADETKNHELVNYYAGVQKYSDHPVRVRLYLDHVHEKELPHLVLKAYESKCQLLEWVKPEQATLEDQEFAEAWEK